MKTKLLLLFLLLFTSAAFATPTTPTSDFTDNNDGTVTHKTTGLTWMRCAMGQTWTGSACTGTVKTYTYAKARRLTTSFAGFSDWRLPNIAELQTIVERENFNPAINTTAFPNTGNGWFWSSSRRADNSNHAWVVDFDYGYGYFSYRVRNHGVRLVRGGQWTFGSLPQTTPTSDFTDHQDGTVTHKRTGLMWQRCAAGKTWTGSACTGIAKTYTYAKAQQLTSTFAGFSDWRVPNENELLSIVEYGAYNPAINTAVFPKISYGRFWSSSSYANNSGLAWVVDFFYGFDYNHNKDYDKGVLLVRGGQWIFGSLPDLTTTITASTNSVKSNQNITYTATMTNNGTGAATNATLVFDFPLRGTTYVTVPSGCVSKGKSYRCTVPSLAAGASLTQAITVNYAQRGALNVVGLAITDSDDSEESNNKAQVMTTITP
ncbi:MAG: DUF1566 domain-containing protein [Methylovulum sp.]|nr:DUF1566 domain-containing protein [Methylovulum sp.]